MRTWRSSRISAPWCRLVRWRRFDGVDQRFDDLRADMNTRFDAGDNRLGRLETRVDTLIGTVSDLGQRVTRLEVSA